MGQAGSRVWIGLLAKLPSALHSKLKAGDPGVTNSGFGLAKE